MGTQRHGTGPRAGRRQEHTLTPPATLDSRGRGCRSTGGTLSSGIREDSSAPGDRPAQSQALPGRRHFPLHAHHLCSVRQCWGAWGGGPCGQTWYLNPRQQLCVWPERYSPHQSAGRGGVTDQRRRTESSGHNWPWGGRSDCSRAVVHPEHLPPPAPSPVGRKAVVPQTPSAIP